MGKIVFESLIAILVVYLIWGLKKYIAKKFENVAMKEDLKEIETIKNEISSLYNTFSSHEIEHRKKRIDAFEEIMGQLGKISIIIGKMLISRGDEFTKLFQDMNMIASELINLVNKKTLYLKMEEYKILVVYRELYEKIILDLTKPEFIYNIPLILSNLLNCLEKDFTNSIFINFEKIKIEDCVRNREYAPEITGLLEKLNVYERMCDGYAKAMDVFRQRPQLYLALSMNLNLKLIYKDGRLQLI